jgi:hypothetical protein
MNLLLVFFSLSALSAFAANERVTPAGGVPCHEEVQLLCPGLSGLKLVAECMIKHEAESGPECRAYIEKLKPVMRAGNSMEEDLASGRGSGGRGIPGLGGGRPAISYNGWYTPFATPAGIQFHLARASFNVSKSQRDTVSLSLSGNTAAYDRAVTIPGVATLPSQFYAADVGAQYSHRADDGHTFSAGAQVGKASDKPLKDKTVVSASVAYSAPSPPHSRWIYSLFYSNNSTFLNGLPIPGVAYMYVTDDFVGIFGFPFASIRWRPSNPWTISAALFGNNVSAEVASGERRELQGFVGFRSQHYSYMRYDRVNTDDRVVLADNRVSGGIRFPLFGSLEAELEGGYAFGRSVYETDKASFHVDSALARAYFDNTWFAGWNFRLPLN